MTFFANEESETHVERLARNHTGDKQSGANLSPRISGFQAGLLPIRSHDFSRAVLGIMAVFPARIWGLLSSPLQCWGDTFALVNHNQVGNLHSNPGPPTGLLCNPEQVT